MLKYNFERIFKARGIDKPFTFLKNAGFSVSFASRIKNNKVSRLELKHLERLCFLLKCTPNDLLEWVPDSNIEIDNSHPLEQLRKTKTNADMVKTISSIPLGEMERIENLIREELKNAL